MKKRMVSELKNNNTMNRSILFLFFFFTACSKEQSASQADIDRAATTKAWLQGKSLRLVSYTSSTPIDYDPTDTVPAGTDHWRYVPYSLTDDSNVIHENTVTVYQGLRHSPDISDDHFDRPFDCFADSKGVHLKYMSHVYAPLTYNSVEYNDSTVTLHYLQGDVDLISVFKILK